MAAKWVKTIFYVEAFSALNQSCKAVFLSRMQGLFSSKKTACWAREEAQLQENGKMKRLPGGEGCTLITLRRENYSGGEQGLRGSALKARWKNKETEVRRSPLWIRLDKRWRQHRKSQIPYSASWGCGSERLNTKTRDDESGEENNNAERQTQTTAATKTSWDNKSMNPVRLC